MYSVRLTVRYIKCYLLCVVGVAQGVVTGIRGLCNGLGPALFGFIFFLFHVDLNEPREEDKVAAHVANQSIHPTPSVLHNIREVSFGAVARNISCGTYHLGLPVFCDLTTPQTGLQV